MPGAYSVVHHSGALVMDLLVAIVAQGFDTIKTDEEVFMHILTFIADIISSMIHLLIPLDGQGNRE